MPNGVADTSVVFAIGGSPISRGETTIFCHLFRVDGLRGKAFCHEESNVQRIGAMSIAVMSVIISSQIATAQFDPGRHKVLGEAMAGHEHQSYQQLGQQRAQVLYYHAQSQEPIPMAEAKELVAGVQKDLKASDAALAKIKTAHAKEPEVLKQIALIEKHHAKAHEVCGMAEEACLKKHGEHVVIAKCCSDMWHELDAAQTETKKLFKMLKIEKMEAPKKIEANK